MLKEREIGKGNMYISNQICCAEYNHSHMSNISEKNFQIRTLIKQLLVKYHFFKKLPQISYINKKSYHLGFFRLTASSL